MLLGVKVVTLILSHGTLIKSWYTHALSHACSDEKDQGAIAINTHTGVQGMRVGWTGITHILSHGTHIQSWHTDT